MMQTIDRKKFFDSYRESFGPLRQQQVDGLDRLIACLEGDNYISDIRWAAYMLATVKHETGHSFQPVREGGRGKGMAYGKPNPVTGKVYYGRGYVQLTWVDNYRAMGKIFDVDLVGNPDLALGHELAYRIMSYGMRLGSFTGVGLNRYIHGETCDFVQARKIINGMDCAERIAAYATDILSALKEAARQAL